MIVNFHAVLLG